MASVTFKVLQNVTLREDGTRLVIIRVTVQRIHRYIGTGVYLKEKHFNPEGSYDKANWVRKSYGEPSAVATLNGIIKSWLDRADEVKKVLIDQGQPFSAADFRAKMDGDINESFTGFVERLIADYRAKNQSSCARCSVTVINNLREFYKVDSKTGVVAFSEMTRERMQQFENWLINKPRKQKTTDAKRRNTATGYLVRLHSHIRAYVIENNLPDAADPLRGRIFPHAEVEIVRLNEAEIDHWLATPVPAAENKRRNGRLEHARKLYICCYGIQGIRAGDLLSARVSQLQRVHEMVEGKVVSRWRFMYESQKRNLTKGILIQEPILGILLDYCKGKQPDQFIFPFLNNKYRNATPFQLERPIQAQIGDIDKMLVQVASILGIHKHVTLHTARHSFAEHLMDLTGELKTLQDALGHTDVSTTQRYISRMKQTRVDRGNSVYSRWQVKDDETTDDDSQQNASAAG